MRIFEGWVSVWNKCVVDTYNRSQKNIIETVKEQELDNEFLIVDFKIFAGKLKNWWRSAISYDLDGTKVANQTDFTQTQGQYRYEWILIWPYVTCWGLC